MTTMTLKDPAKFEQALNFQTYMLQISVMLALIFDRTLKHTRTVRAVPFRQSGQNPLKKRMMSGRLWTRRKRLTLERPITIALTELGLAGSCGALFIWMGINYVFLVVFTVSFSAYVIGVFYLGIGRALLRKQGVKRPAWRTRSFGETSLFGVSAVIVIFMFTYMVGRTPQFNMHFFLCLPIYPIYGYCQHWLLQGMGTANLIVIRIPVCLIPVIMGIVFAVVHVKGGNYKMVATGFLGMVFSALFIRHRDLLPLGIWHGILGGVFYYVFKGSDALSKVMSQLNIDSPLQ